MPTTLLSRAATWGAGRQHGKGLTENVVYRGRLDVPPGDDTDGATCFLLTKSESNEPAGRGVELTGGRVRRVRLALAKVNSTRDVFLAEDLFRVQLVVCATGDAEVLRVVGAAKGARLDVIQLEKGA